MSLKFFSVFSSYNTSVWPAQIVFYVVGYIAVFLAIGRFSFSGRTISAILAFFWLWMGIAYHLVFFTALLNRIKFT
jgi:hypothetical protein